VTLGTLLIYRTIPLVAIPGGRILRYRDYYDEFPQLWISPWMLTLLALAGLVAVAYVSWRLLPGLWRALQFRYGEIRNAANDGHFKTTQTLISGVILLVTALALLIIAVWLLMVISFHLGRGGELVQVGFFDLINGRWGFSFDANLIGLIQLLVLLGGFLWSLRLAQKTALRLYRRKALLGLLPWALLFLLMMLAAWQVFTLPMEMRGTLALFG